MSHPAAVTAAALAASLAAASTTAAAGAGLRSVATDHVFLPPSHVALFYGGAAPYTTEGSLGPLTTQSAGHQYAGPVAYQYAGYSSSPSASILLPAASYPLVPAQPPSA